MKKACALDFDDIIMKTVLLLQNNPEVLEFYQHKFRYVLVDEYQDTNYAQYVLTSLLAGYYENICVVGDDDQSIYKFRGATITNILEFEKQFKDAKTIRLEQNYRSTGNILNAANEVIRNNVGRKGKELWTDHGDGAKIKLHRSDSQEGEAAYIADTIREGVEQGRRWGDFAVLYRNNVLSDNIAAAFIRAGVPVPRVQGTRLLLPRRGQGYVRLPVGDRESGGRAAPAPHHQRSRAQDRRQIGRNGDAGSQWKTA